MTPRTRTAVGCYSCGRLLLAVELCQNAECCHIEGETGNAGHCSECCVHAEASVANPTGIAPPTLRANTNSPLQTPQNGLQQSRRGGATL